MVDDKQRGQMLNAPFNELGFTLCNVFFSVFPIIIVVTLNVCSYELKTNWQGNHVYGR